MKVARTKHRSDVQSVVAVDLLPGLVGTLSEHDRGWRLSHERSGLAIGPGVWSSPEEIVAAVARAGAGAVDWTRPAAELRDDPRVHDLAKILTCSAPTRAEGHHLANPDELGDLPTERDLRIAASTMLARLLHESGRRAVERGENIAEETTFIEWVDLHSRVKRGRTMTACAMLDSMLLAAAPAPAGSTRLSGECLAREIHKCEKAAIESGHAARQHSTTWVPFDELPEAAKKGRMAQAEFLEKTCDLAFFVWDK